MRTKRDAQQFEEQAYKVYKHINWVSDDMAMLQEQHKL